MADPIALTKQGIAAHKAGDIPAATRLLVQAVQTDPAYEMAWLWLASCMPSAGEKRYCLDQALRANGQSAPARSGLAQLGDVRSVMPDVLSVPPIAAPTMAWVQPPEPRTPDQERQDIERVIATYTQSGWLVVSQTERSAQLRKPKVWSAGGTVLFALLVICGFLLWYPLFGLAIVLLALLFADYIGKKEQLVYITPESLRERYGMPHVEQLASGGTICSSCRRSVGKSATMCKHCLVKFVA